MRVAAATALLRHIQQSRPILTAVEATTLTDLAAAKGTALELKAGVILVLGSLRPDPRLTAERLKAYDPISTSGPVPPPGR